MKRLLARSAIVTAGGIALIAASAVGQPDPHRSVGPTTSTSSSDAGQDAGGQQPVNIEGGVAALPPGIGDGGQATRPGDGGGLEPSLCVMSDVQLPDDAFCKTACSGDTVCLSSGTGEPICNALPATVQSGASLEIRVIGPEACKDEIDLSTSTVPGRDVLFRPQQKLQSGAFRWRVIKVVTLNVATDETMRAVRVAFTRRRVTGGDVVVQRSYEISIDHGQYYLSVGALVPVVFNGSRTVRAVRLPGLSEYALRVEEDEFVTAALTLNFFPFGGKRKGQVFCCSDGVRLGELIGFQFGVDLDFGDVTDQFYAGALLEPIAGLGLGGGLALVKGDVLDHGFSRGMLIEDTNNLPFSRQYLLRPYAGITLSLEIIDTLFAAKSSLAGKSLTQ